MPEKASHKVVKQPSIIEKVFIGVGRATKEIAHTQEKGILWVINKQIVPRLSVENQKKAKINKARIELWAKRAGIGLTATEIIVGTIVSLKGLQKAINTRRNKSTPEIGRTPHKPEIKLDPFASPAQEVAQMITRPIKIKAHEAAMAQAFEEVKPTIRNFVPETFPTHTDIQPNISTKTFFQGGGATDFCQSQNHYLFSGNDAFDTGLSRNFLHDIQALASPFPRTPLIHMDYLGSVGRAVRLNESTFARGNNNRPFWHSELLRQSNYNETIRALERGLPAVSNALEIPSLMLADKQAYADQIAQIMQELHLYPWSFQGKGFDEVDRGINVNNAGSRFVKELPSRRVTLRFGKHLWDPQFDQLRDATLPTIATLLDNILSARTARQSLQLFVPSPSFGVMPNQQEPYGDMLAMQSLYSFLIPLERSRLGMSPIEPFIHKLPGFSTSPVLDRGIRFFQPIERRAAESYEWKSRIISGKPESKRAEMFLEALRSIAHMDSLDAVNAWRKMIFEKQLSIN